VANGGDALVAKEGAMAGVTVVTVIGINMME